LNPARRGSYRAGVASNTIDWQQQAACKGHPRTADFYPPQRTERKHERIAREHRAKSVCATCPVIGPCLQHAIRADERYGVWGGLTQDERRSILLTA
jgi:WhiB family redox-sensing transcriptional regulator